MLSGLESQQTKKLREFIFARQFEQQVLTSGTNRMICLFFFNRWRKNTEQPIKAAAPDGCRLIE